jgi:hypothetical protein
MKRWPTKIVELLNSQGMVVKSYKNTTEAFKSLHISDTKLLNLVNSGEAFLVEPYGLVTIRIT